MSLTIVVCIKQIIDPEIPASQFKIDPMTKRQAQGGHSLVVSPYDQNALEVALQLKERQGGTVTALSVGTTSAVTALRSALAMGADDAILVADPLVETIDPQRIARLLARAIRKIGQYDLILAGCESGDWADRFVPPFLAEELSIGFAGFVSRIERQDRHLVLRRIVEDGYEVLEAEPPLLVSIASDETNTPRYPKLKDIMAAGKKTIPVWTAVDLAIDPAAEDLAASVVIADVYVPVKESRCEMIEGETAAEQAGKLAARLRELKLI
jgi:electron transfer flavoprotein beta subunit